MLVLPFKDVWYVNNWYDELSCQHIRKIIHIWKMEGGYFCEYANKFNETEQITRFNFDIFCGKGSVNEFMLLWKIKDALNQALYS